MKIKVKSTGKATLPAGNCFYISAHLVVAKREAEDVHVQSVKRKQVKRFGYMMGAVKASLLQAGYAEPGVGKIARKLAQEAADAEFSYLNSTKPFAKRLKQFQGKMESLQSKISDLSDTVSRRCGMDPNPKYRQSDDPKERNKVAADLRALDMKAQARLR